MSRNFLLFGVMCLVWGLTWLPVKVAGQHVPPVFFAAARFVIAAPLLLAFASRSRLVSPLPHLGRLAASGLLINTGCYSFLFWGVTHAPTGLSAIVNMSLIPVFTILFAWAYGQEGLDRRKLIAIVLGVAGLILLYSGRLPGIGTPDPQQALGLGAIVIATASYCWGAILSKPLMQDFGPVALAGWQATVGALSLTLVSLVLEPVTPAHVAALFAWPTVAALAFMIFGGTFLAFLIYLKLLRDWGAFRAGLYAFVSPFIAVLVGTLALAEPLGWREITGGGIMLGAAALAIRSRKG